MSDDAAVIGRLVRSLQGTCRICGCNADSCRLEDGDRCCWIDNLRTLCSNPRCVTAAYWKQKRYRRERRRIA